MTRLTMQTHGGLPQCCAAFAPPQPTEPRRMTVLLMAGAAVLFLAMFAGLVVTTTLLVLQSREDAAEYSAPASVPAAAAQDATAETDAVDAMSDHTEAAAEVTRHSVDLLGRGTPAAVAAAAFEPMPAQAETESRPTLRLARGVQPPSCTDQLETLVKITRVRFPLGSDEPHSSDMPRVRNIATALAMCPEVELVVEGHSDRRGSDRRNMELSLYRAETVIRLLREEGFETGAMEAVGFGARRPVNLSGTRSGEGENRRVQFQLVPRNAEARMLVRP